MPHTLRRVDTSDDTLTELGVLVGFDDDLAGEATRISNRIRRLLTSIHPALERVLGPRIAHPAVLEILSRCGGPTGIREAGTRKITTIATKHAPRMGTRLVADVHAALETQTVIVPGTTAAKIVLPKLADSLKTILQQRKSISDDAERMLDDHPLSRVLTSMPGIGVRTGARILLEVGDGSAFASAAHLAAYAGIAPVTHRSGTSIRGEHPARSGNRKLKRALLLSAFAALHDTASRTYYDRKRSEGKKLGRRPHLPSQTPLRCSLRHAQEPRTLPIKRRDRRLTKTIGTPPIRACRSIVIAPAAALPMSLPSTAAAGDVLDDALRGPKLTLTGYRATW